MPMLQMVIRFIPCAIYTVALLLYLAWRNIGGMRLMLLVGVTIGALCHVKYHGIILGAVLASAVLCDVLMRGRKLWEPLLGVSVSVLVFSPLLMRNATDFGNPLAPLFGRFFSNSDPATQLDFRPLELGFVEGLLDFVRSPMDMFVFGGVSYDGQTFGTPYLLIFLPMVIFFWREIRHRWAVVGIASLYYILWFVLMFRVSRFLIPIFPIIAAFAMLAADHLPCLQL